MDSMLQAKVRACDWTLWGAANQKPNSLVGCVRVAPLTVIESGVVSSAIGGEILAKVLRELGTTRERACDMSPRGGLSSPSFEGRWAPAWSRLHGPSPGGSRWMWALSWPAHGRSKIWLLFAWVPDR
jgi:hypothetical protein